MCGCAPKRPYFIIGGNAPNASIAGIALIEVVPQIVKASPTEIPGGAKTPSGRCGGGRSSWTNYRYPRKSGQKNCRESY